MANRFETAAAWLGSRIQGPAGRSVSYQRGSSAAVPITATPALVTYLVAGRNGLSTQLESWDWIMTADELGLEPIDGDTISETLHGNTRTYETMPLGDKKCFEWLDTAGTLLLVHSKVV